eukprot:gene16415-biopygen1212
MVDDNSFVSAALSLLLALELLASDRAGEGVRPRWRRRPSAPEMASVRAGEGVRPRLFRMHRITLLFPCPGGRAKGGHGGADVGSASRAHVHPAKLGRAQVRPAKLGRAEGRPA